MKIKLLIAAGDTDYVERLSDVLSEKHADSFEVSVCSSADRLQDLLVINKYDAVVMEPDFVPAVNLNLIRLPLILWDESALGVDAYENLKKIRKYQRISSIAGNILEYFADVGVGAADFAARTAHITAVWSPHGGVGKTTVSLAYAARKVLTGKQTVYLNMENFSSTSAYFTEDGKSISSVFEKLDSNVEMLLKGIRLQDSRSGINYFCGPNNFDDINILNPDDIETLIAACASAMDELVVDLSSHCDERNQKIFDLADTVLLVCDSSGTSRVKMSQFISQHNIAQRIQAKSVLVNNKGAKITEPSIARTIHLPFVQSVESDSVYKTLSGSDFEWKVSV